jgi:hypothetical protein
MLSGDMMDETAKTQSDYANLNYQQLALLHHCLPSNQIFEMQLSTQMQRQLICCGSTVVITEIGTGLSLRITVEVLPDQESVTNICAE